MSKRERLGTQVVMFAAAFLALPAVASAATLDISTSSSTVRSDRQYTLNVSGTTEIKASVTVYEDSDVSRPCAATPLDEDARSTDRLIFFQEAREGSFSYAREISPRSFTIEVEDDTFYNEYVPPRSPAAGRYKLCGYVLYTIGNNPPPDASDSADIEFTSGAPKITSGPPKKTKSTRAKFVFSSPNPTEFRCTLDGESFGSCASPFRIIKLDVRKHRFGVRAVSPSGSVGPEAVYRWRTVKP